MRTNQEYNVRAVRDAIDNLLELVGQVAGGRSADDVDSLRQEVQQTILALVSAVLVADGKYGAAEHAFLSRLIDTTDDPEVEFRLVGDYAELWGTLRKEVPLFLKAAVEYDAAHDTDMARAMMREIQLAGNNTSISDGRLVVAENEVIRGYLGLLDDYIEGWKAQ